MKLNDKGYKLIAKFEGFKAEPYLCPSKLATIGYGNTFYPNGKKVSLIDKPITEKEAFEMLKEIADRFAKAVSKNIKSDVTQNQFNALVSFAYNTGMANFINSTLLKRVNENPNDKDIEFQFNRWIRGGGVILNGLVKRRKAEANLYFTK